VEGVFYGLYRIWGARSSLRTLIPPLLRLETIHLRPLAVVVHKFMGPEELETPLGRERLDACVFKVPLHGKMVSMCELNGTPLRSEENLRHQKARKLTAVG